MLIYRCDLNHPQSPELPTDPELGAAVELLGLALSPRLTEGQGSVQLAVAEDEAETFRGWVDAEGLRCLGALPGQVMVFGWVAR